MDFFFSFKYQPWPKCPIKMNVSYTVDIREFETNSNIVLVTIDSFQLLAIVNRVFGGKYIHYWKQWLVFLVRGIHWGIKKFFGDPANNGR